MLAKFDSRSAEPPAPEPPPSDVLDLTEAMATPAPSKEAATFRTIDAVSDVVFTDRPPEPPVEPAPRAIEEPRRQLRRCLRMPR